MAVATATVATNATAALGVFLVSASASMVPPPPLAAAASAAVGSVALCASDDVSSGAAAASNRVAETSVLGSFQKAQQPFIVGSCQWSRWES